MSQLSVKLSGLPTRMDRRPEDSRMGTANVYHTYFCAMQCATTALCLSEFRWHVLTSEQRSGGDRRKYDRTIHEAVNLKPLAG